MYSCLDGNYLPNSSSYVKSLSVDEKKTVSEMQKLSTKEFDYQLKEFNKSTYEIDWSKSFCLVFDEEGLIDKDEVEDSDEKHLYFEFNVLYRQVKLYINNDDNRNHYSEWSWNVDEHQLETQKEKCMKCQEMIIHHLLTC